MLSYAHAVRSKDSIGSSTILTLLAGALFGLATAIRGNGLLSGIIFAWDALGPVFSILFGDRALATLRRLSMTVLAGLLVAAGYAIPQYIAYREYCNADLQRPWCSRLPPSIYGFVQEHYWEVGFLKYWTVSNIPLFILAAPVLFLLFNTGYGAMHHGRSVLIAVIGEERPSFTSQASYQADRTAYIHIFERFAMPQLVLALLATTSFHVQIINRISSGYPIWYIVLAIAIDDQSPTLECGHLRTEHYYPFRQLRGKLPRMMVQGFVVYAVVQAGLFSSFLPPAPVASSSTLHGRSHAGRSRSHTVTVNLKDGKGDPYVVENDEDSSYSQAAGNLSHSITPEEDSEFKRIEELSKEKQRTSPWTREGSDMPPVARGRSAGAMTKGKLLTTPSRMLKFIIPLSPRDTNSDRKDIEPLALLVHPQQPLSYLERLIQSELPVLEDGKPPGIVFRAEDTGEDSGKEEKKEDDVDDVDDVEDVEDLSAEDKTRIDGKLMKTGKLNSKGKPEEAPESKPEPEPVDPNHPNFVRWSPSTEIGDFIRDAARAKEFALDVEGAGTIYVGVPSFSDRTYYLRMRLRKTGRRILQLADLKKECDHLAHRGAKQLAQLGFGGLVTWWVAVYYLTFKTDYGWDVMEPVSYLVGLTTVIGAYLWFLWHNRDVSYRSAMQLTVSRRQTQLYEQKGFDIHKWEFLVEEGNRLRREIKMIADEYDVEWDETKDEGHKKVAQALREERKKDKEKKKDEEDDEDDDDDDQESGSKRK
ncbi:hypothetical protein AMS68_004229 [Peltaster fructicola]|uniref:GPI mannosyltransferase 2 n=1 Tax=Peltaster fructicola TaxID=286661 RepID=A0A6H0XVC2_9PEZI|nr:hypothetical protein AMS68_004229 [Peltaster fructicola]